MNRIEQIKSLVESTLEVRKSKVDKARVYSMFEAMMAAIQSDTGIEHSKIEQSIIGFELKVTEDGSNPISYKLAAPGHGPIPIPHECHKKILFCWPRPLTPEIDEICIEIEIPWPCPD